MMPNQRDIYLVPVPFSDLKATKKRPVLIISNNTYNHSQEDCLVMAITSNLHGKNPHALIFENEDLEDGYLPKKSRIRVDKIYALHQDILIRRFGKMKLPKYKECIQCLEDLIHS